MSDPPGWRVRRATSPFGTNWFATAPECPSGPHPTRDCRCARFHTYAEAERFVAEQTS